MSPPQQPTEAAEVTSSGPIKLIDDEDPGMPKQGQAQGDEATSKRQATSNNTFDNLYPSSPIPNVPPENIDRPTPDISETIQEPRSTVGLENLGQTLTPSSKVETASAGEGGKIIQPQEGGKHDDLYLDPTPKTPRLSRSPSRTPENTFDGREEEGSTSEIQSIMDQFRAGDDPNSEEELLSTEQQDSLLDVPVKHPPRRSSLEPLKTIPPQPDLLGATGSTFHTSQKGLVNQDTPAAQSPDIAALKRLSSRPQSVHFGSQGLNSPSSPHSSKSLPREPPPAPDPEPDLPFDFHRFLEQLRHRTADPVAKFLRSFLIEFGKKQWMAHEQVKIISDFLTFITNKMAQCEVWSGVSDAEFDNAKEGMEKLVMNRLYSETFSPAIPPPAPLSGGKGKRKNIEKLLGPGRRGQHQEDIERDDILGQKVRIYGWVQEEHLDIPLVGDSGRRFLILAQRELLKIKTYRAPRDKIICVLNCCKVIFGLLRNSKSSDTSADSFVPLLIYVVLHANPDHLVSNVQYILRFRNQDKLGGEAGYYLSSLMGAIQFIENLDRTSLTVSDEEFERHVEASVSAIAEGHEEGPMPPPRPSPRLSSHPGFSEKSALSQPEVVPRTSAEFSSPRRSNISRGNTDNVMGSDGTEENTAVSGLLRTIQRPLSSLGRMFSDDPSTMPPGRSQAPPLLPQPAPRLSPAVFLPPRHSEEASRPSADDPRLPQHPRDGKTRKVIAEDAAARQASAETAEAQRIQRVEHHNVVETLAGMFPNLDKDVIDDVVTMKQGRVGLAVDACLALNT